MRLYPAACGGCHHSRLLVDISKDVLCYLPAGSPSLQAVSPGLRQAVDAVAASYRGRVPRRCIIMTAPVRSHRFKEMCDVHSHARISLQTFASTLIIMPPRLQC